MIQANFSGLLDAGGRWLRNDKYFAFIIAPFAPNLSHELFLLTE
jgi:hypothetical protein